MPIPTHTIRCTKNERIAKDVYDVRFTKPEGFTFKAGQFVLFDVALIEKPTDMQTRALSIASLPDEHELGFIVKLKPGGRMSRWIAEVLKAGMEAKMKGPFGNFVLDRTTDKEYFFIATSAGVAPFRPMIVEALKAGEMRKIDLVFGVRSEEDLFWEQELAVLAKEHKNFSLHIGLSQPNESWKGHRGRVQTLAPAIAKDFSKKNVYICGSPDMTNELKKISLEEWGIEKKDLHVEGYI
ncbi:FAD-dependent oxidoreductase [Candidatus Peregrinibacteria bacterium]|nr:FAD-dependent oxidoreductase [Candidatus Peregrinibacteria bacterium]